jgi:hypothetical protein
MSESLLLVFGWGWDTDSLKDVAHAGQSLLGGRFSNHVEVNMDPVWYVVAVIAPVSELNLW